MELLHGAARDLLIELIERNRDSDLARVLADKFTGLDHKEDMRLRSIISYLIRLGYLYIPENGWADDVPYMAALTYEGENYLFFEQEHITKNGNSTLPLSEPKSNLPNHRLAELIRSIDQVKTCFQSSGGKGMPTLNTISGTIFEKWKSQIQFEMHRLKQDEFVLRIIELTKSFNGWNDEKVFTELCSKLEILLEHSDEYYNMKEGKGDLVLDKKKVFVVHGRNEKIRRSMFDFLRSIGLNPIEWDEAKRMTGKPTPYIGEILDTVFTNAQTVIVLITPDDEGKLRDEFLQSGDKSNERNLTPQARQNVIYEAGMAMGRCPDRTVLIEFGDNLRPYSDIGGLNVIRIKDNTAEKRISLLSVIKTTGADVDDLTGKKDWLSTGDFTL